MVACRLALGTACPARGALIGCGRVSGGIAVRRFTLGPVDDRPHGDAPAATTRSPRPCLHYRAGMNPNVRAAQAEPVSIPVPTRRLRAEQIDAARSVASTSEGR